MSDMMAIVGQYVADFCDTICLAIKALKCFDDIHSPMHELPQSNRKAICLLLNLVPALK